MGTIVLLTIVAIVIVGFLTLSRAGRPSKRQLPFIQDLVDGVCPCCGDRLSTAPEPQWYHQCSCARCGFKVRAYFGG